MISLIYAVTMMFIHSTTLLLTHLFLMSYRKNVPKNAKTRKVHKSLLFMFNVIGVFITLMIALDLLFLLGLTDRPQISITTFVFDVLDSGADLVVMSVFYWLYRYLRKGEE